ncbi:hypothetical protein PR048_015386 [Dryococelus australis]|uniref:Uncharacterized protein n=1 Tax=Dryococelus australis TaxID=614101 RepID=A0ABQ9HGT0_9NEOP|nr:hypothetical protein PR048_015386 [Dryococelus australis]
MPGAGKREIPEKNPLTSGIVRHDSHMRKFGGRPRRDSNPASSLTTTPPRYRPHMPAIWWNAGDLSEDNRGHTHVINRPSLASDILTAVRQSALGNLHVSRLPGTARLLKSIDYANLYNVKIDLLFTDLNNNLSLKLQILQNFCVRYILNSSRRDYIGSTPFYKTVNWPLLKKRRTFKSLLLLQNISRLRCPHREHGISCQTKPELQYRQSHLQFVLANYFLHSTHDPKICRLSLKTEKVEGIVWAALNIEFLRADEDEANAGIQGWGETGDPRENPPTSGGNGNDSHVLTSGETPQGIEPGSSWWEANAQNAVPPRSRELSAERLIETRYRRQDCTPVQCFERRGDERPDAHVSATPSAPLPLGLRRSEFLQPGGNLNIEPMSVKLGEHGAAPGLGAGDYGISRVNTPTQQPPHRESNPVHLGGRRVV